MKPRILIVVLGLCLGMAYGQQLLNNNNSIIQLVKAGMSDGVIISTIQTQPAHFNLEVNDLIALKQAGVSDAVMAAMIAKNSSTAEVGSQSAAATNLPTDIGLYYNVKGVYQEIEPEVVTKKTGGFLKAIASDGIVKPDINGHLNGAHSPTSLKMPVQLLVVLRDGDAVTEYQLLRLHSKAKSREFRTVTGGVIHSSTGASRDDVKFTWTKVASLTYSIVLPPDLAPGEYGIFPPGGYTSQNMISSGEIYSFRIVE